MNYLLLELPFSPYSGLKVLLDLLHEGANYIAAYLEICSAIGACVSA